MVTNCLHEIVTSINIQLSLPPYSYNRYYYQNYLYKKDLCIKHAKKCALIAVEEILLSNPIIFREDNSIMLNKSYWELVKKEIEAL